MTRRWIRLGFTAGLFAAGIVTSTALSAWAFTRENGSADGGNYSFGDPDQKTTSPDSQNSSQGSRPFGSNGPTVQFGVQQGQGPLNTFGQSNRYTMPDSYFGRLNGK